MFGWGKKKPAEPAREVRRLSLDQVTKTAEEVRRLRADQNVLEASNALHKTNALLLELAKIREELEGDDLQMENVEKRLRPLVSRGKSMLIASLRSNAVQIKPIHTYEDMIRADGDLEHQVKRMGNILGKQTKIIHVFAEKYAARLKQILEEVEENRRGIRANIRRHQDDDALAQRVSEGVATIGALEQSVRDNLKKTSTEEHKRAHVDLQIAKVSGSIDEFKASEQYTQFLKASEAAKENLAARDMLRHEVSTQFTKISRPLGRYVHISSDKDQTVLLKELIKDPLEAVGRSGTDSVVMLLEGIRKAVLSGSISVKDVDKTVAAIAQTQNCVGVFARRASELDIASQENERVVLEANPTQLHALEAELESLREEKRASEKNMVDANGAAKMAVESIPMEIAKVQDGLRRFTNTEYVVVYEPPRE